MTATTTGKAHCVMCRKAKSTYKCGGCLQELCFNDLSNHKRELDEQLDKIDDDHDLFRQVLTEETVKPKKNILMQQVDEWERQSINKIRRTAKEARQVLLKHITQQIKELETKLNKLTEQLRQSREENDFYETDLRHWNEELIRLTRELAKPSNITIREDSSSFVPKISVDIVSASFCSPIHGVIAKWIQNGVTVSGGSDFNQLLYPSGIYVDDDQTVYISDCGNHRIVEWKSGATSGKVVAGGNGKGNRPDQLNCPSDVVFDKEKDCFIICDRNNRRIVRWPRQNGTSGQTIISNIDCRRLTMDDGGYLYVSDPSKHEVQRWRIGDSHGIVVAGGNGQGDRLDQLDNPANIFVDQDQSVYVSDQNNHRVMKWIKDTKEGIVVAGGQGQGYGLTQLSAPYGVVVDQMGTVYMADFDNDRIMGWLKGAKQGSIVVGGNGEGKNVNQLDGPAALSFDRQGNLYVADSNNHRIQKFNIYPNLNS